MFLFGTLCYSGKFNIGTFMLSGRETREDTNQTQNLKSSKHLLKLTSKQIIKIHHSQYSYNQPIGLYFVIMISIFLSPITLQPEPFLMYCSIFDMIRFMCS